MEAEDMDIVDGQTTILGTATGGAQGGAGPTDSKQSPASWNTPKHREEVESYRAKLSDQGFNPADFGDPLSAERPIQKVYSRTFPQGTEERLRALIAKVDKQ